MHWVRGVILAGCLLLATPAVTQSGDDVHAWVDDVADILGQMTKQGGFGHLAR
jgi:hypothetical protein